MNAHSTVHPFSGGNTVPTQDNRINDTSAAILGLLHQEPMIGGHICEMSNKWIAPYFSITRSQVYRELVVMEKQGLVREGATGPRGSLTYRITPAGKRAFSLWFNEGLSLDTIRNSMALRVALADLTGRANLKALVDTMKMEHAAARDKVIALVNEAREQELTDDAQALFFAESYHDMCVNWLNSIKI